jgi:hypothetical protein
VFSLNLFRRLVLACTVILFGTPLSWSQEDAVIGGSAGVRINLATSSFNAISGMPSPDGTILRFTSASTTLQPGLSLFADLRITSDLRVGGRVSYVPIQLKYSANETVPIATSTGGTYNATLQHRLRMDFTQLGIEPYLRYSPLDWIAFDVGLQATLSLSSDYLQTQIFTDPANLVFIDGSVEQVTGRGAVPGNSVFAPAVQARAEGMVPLSNAKSLFLIPSVSLSQHIGSIHSSATITPFSVTLGLGVRYSMGGRASLVQRVTDTVFVSDTIFTLSSQVTSVETELTATTEERFEKPDTTTVLISRKYITRLPKPPAVLAAAVRLSFINSTGEVSEEAQLKIWRIKRTRIVPILPIVTFDSNATTIPSRYVQLSKAQATQWKERRAGQSDGIHWQYNVLNIIASRMVKNQATKLGLLVYDDGTKQGRTTVEARAREVQRYMTSTFGIDSKRFTVELRNGQASQQPWVMFVDSTRALLSPLTMIDTVLEARLPHVKIEPDVISEAGLRSWKIVAFHKGRAVHVFSDSAELPQALLWDMNQDLRSTDVSVGQIGVRCFVTDNDGVSSESEMAKINIRHQAVTDVSGMLAERVEVLRVLGADYLNTPDEEVFAGRKLFTRVEVFPSKQRDMDFLYVPAPITYMKSSQDDWFRKGLHVSDQEFFNHVEVYVNDVER